MEEAIKGTGSRILVVKLSSLGDLFHALPAVHNLKKGLGCAVDWVVQSEYTDLAACFRDVDRIISFPRHGSPWQFFRFARSLRKDKYLYVIDMQGLLKSAVISRLARGERRIGPSFHREGSHVFYSGIAGRPDRDRHAVEQVMDVVDYLGVERIPPEFPVTFPAWEPVGEAPRIAVFPLTRWRSKNWPQDSFKAALKTLQNRIGATVFIMGADADAEVCGYLHSDLRGKAFNLAGRLSLVETGSVLSGMDAVISNDSGPMHLAAAIGIPVVAVFGPTNPARTGPFGKGHIVLAGKKSCIPCYRRECPLGPTICLREVSPGAVVEAVISILSRRG